METSSKTGKNVSELFVEAAYLLYKDYVKYKKPKDTTTLGTRPKSDPKKKCC